MENIHKLLKIIGFIYRNFTYLAGGTYLAGLLTAPQFTIQFTINFFTLYNYAPLKIITGFVLAWLIKNYSRTFLQTLGDTIYNVVQDVTDLFTFERPPQDTLDGIPHSELLDHLFTEKSFKRDEIKDKFLIGHHRTLELGANLEKVGVLVRGDNNARVLNEEYSRGDIASIINGVQFSRHLKPLVTKKQHSLHFSTPSAQEIKQSVEMATVSRTSGEQPLNNDCTSGVLPLDFKVRPIYS